MSVRRLLGVVAGVFATSMSCSDWDRGTFVGTYFHGFEASAFTECGRTESWWLTDESSNLFSRLPVEGETPEIVRRGFITVSGRLSPRGSYGHLGASPRELIVTRVHGVVPVTQGQCP